MIDFNEYAKAKENAKESLFKYTLLARSSIAMIAVSVWTVFCSILCIILCSIIKSPKFFDRYIYYWARFILWAFNLEVRVNGIENLPGKRGGLLLFNHASLFDVPVLMVALSQTITFRFGAKIELFAIPFFGKAMRAIGMLPIARHQREKVLKLYKKSLTNVENGFWYALAPEGTRQKHKDIGGFKKGPFWFAIHGQLNVVPIVITGALDALPKSDWVPCQSAWSHIVEVHILPPISAQGLSEDEITQLQGRVRSSMLKVFNEPT